tara:strand:- start:366 stop:935 length:570 start_codon:yes stop_codon:yes gene_type:complete
MAVDIKSWELNPAEKRTEAVAQMLMKVGYEPRRAYQMANKISGLGETIGEFTPGISHEMAMERGEGPINMALLDFIPGGVLAKKAVTPSIRAAIAKQKVKKYQKEGLVKQNLAIKYAKIKELERQLSPLFDELKRVDPLHWYPNAPASPKGKLIRKKIDTIEAEKRKLTREWKRENKDWVPIRLADHFD